MKKILFIIIIFPFLLSSCKRSNRSIKRMPIAEIAFNDTLYHFGDISLDTPIDSFDFVFKNTGKEKLVVLGVQTSCRCTYAVYPHHPINPGEQSYIRVTYDGRGRSAEYFRKSIKVITNAPKDIILQIEGNLK